MLQYGVGFVAMAAVTAGPNETPANGDAAGCVSPCGTLACLIIRAHGLGNFKFANRRKDNTWRGYGLVFPGMRPTPARITQRALNQICRRCGADKTKSGNLWSHGK